MSTQASCCPALQFPAFAMERQAVTKTTRPVAIELPEHERGRGEYDLRLLDRLNARLARNAYKAGGGKTADELREIDLRQREALERLPETKADQQWQREAVAESEALARARGEEVEDTGGVKRILDRDPLLSAFRAGRITMEQLDAGLALRECYDRRAEDAGAAEFTGMPAGAHDNARFVFNRMTRAKATIVLGQVQTAILNGHYRTRDGHLINVEAFARFGAEGVSRELALTMVRCVCGQGKSLSSQGEGRAMDRNAKALALGLDVAREVAG